MRKYFVGAAASIVALLLGMGSAIAAGNSTKPNVPSIADGFVSIAVGGGSEAFGDSGTDVISGVSIEGAASGEYNYTTTLGFQGDVVIGSQQFGGGELGGDNITDRKVEAAIHAFYRNDHYLFGGFGQYGNDSYAYNDVGAGGSDHFYGGAEAQVFFGNATLYGQAGAQQFSDLGSTLDGWFGTLEARYFLDPNFRIEAHIGADTLVTDSGNDYFGDVTTLRAGVGAEYRLADTPISVFAKYDYSRATISDASASDNRFLIGAKFNFDSETLLDRDRSGASLKPVENGLPARLGMGP